MQSQFGIQPAILVLKDGTDTTQGKGQLITSINACVALSQIVQQTLGPYGQDIMIVKGQDDDKTTIVTNDGATILQQLQIQHPAARVLASISKTQDTEVGDGTTSVCLLGANLLKEAKPLIEENVSSRIISKQYKKALTICIQTIRDIQKIINIKEGSRQDVNMTLFDIAETSLNSKLIKPFKTQFSQIILQALGYNCDGNSYKLIDNTFLDDNKLSKDVYLQQYQIVKIMGEQLGKSFYYPGFVFPRGFTYAGAAMQPKFLPKGSRIILLNIELELQSSQQGATVECTSTEEFKKLLDAEFQHLKDKMNKIIETGAKLVVSTKSIGDVACSYFAEHGVLTSGRIQNADINKLTRLLSIPVLSATQDITVQNTAEMDECKVETLNDEEYIFVNYPKHSKRFTGSIVLRGASQQFLDESERSLHDALSITKVTLRNPEYIAGAGSIECYLSAKLRAESKKLSGKPQAVFEAFSKALEVIPTTLADNAGFDSVEILNQLRFAHNKAIKQGQSCFNGIDIENDNSTVDALQKHIIEPANIRINALQAAVEASCTILVIDQTFNLPNDTQNIEKDKKDRNNMKKKLDKAGIAPSVMPNGRPSPQLQQQINQNNQRM